MINPPVGALRGLPFLLLPDLKVSGAVGGVDGLKPCTLLLLPEL